MKKQFSLLAIGLCSLGLAHAQSTTTTYSTTSTATNPTYTSPVTTDSTNANASSTTTVDTAPNATYSTNNGVTTTSTTTDVSANGYSPAQPKKDYKNFVFGIYVGLNSTKFKGETLDANRASNGKLAGRLGYQAGFFVRGGGRLFGQIGAEYFASSSNYFVAGQTSASDIRGQIDIKYIQVPVYIGYKLTQSDRGISAVRVQVGLEYANQIGSSANDFGNVNNLQVKSGTFNGLGQLGFDAGPVFLDLTYHYGFSNAIQQNTGFASSYRRILSASVGFKF